MIGNNQERILFEVAKRGPTSKAELRKATGFSESQLDDSILRAEKRGYVSRHVVNRGYNGKSMVYITEEGREYLRRVFSYEGS